MNTEKIKQFILAYKRKHDRWANIKIIAVALNLTKEDVKAGLLELHKAGFLKWYPEKGNPKTSYYVPSTTQERANVEAKKETSEIKGFSEKGMKVIGWIIRGFGAVIGAAAITISADFSLSWTASYLPLWVAWIVSLSIPCYTSFAIEAGIYIRYTVGVIRENKLSWPPATVLLFLTAFIAMGFEMSMITIGQFNKRTALIFEEKKDKPKNNNEKTLAVLKDEETQILENDDYKYLQKQIQRYKNDFEFGSKEYKNLENDFQKKRNDFKVYENKLETIRNKQKTILNDKETVFVDEQKEERRDFYTWFENTFHSIKSGVLEFLVYLMPAIFFVLVAPLGVFVAVGLYRRKN